MKVYKQKYILINHADRSLTPWVIFLPKPPNVNTIENIHRVHVKDMVFRKTEYPQSLRILEQKVKNRILRKSENSSSYKYSEQRFIIEMWKEITGNINKYYEILKFIREEQWKLKYGHWVVINKVVTWIPPWHYRYLNYWTIDDVPEVEYRERDRQFFIFAEWLYRTHKDEYGNFKYLYEQNEKLTRVMLGFLYPKHRRDGATHKALNIGYSILMEAGAKKHFGIQSYDEINAQKHYKEKLLPSFVDMPFFTKPLWGQLGKLPTREFKFDQPQGISSDRRLGSLIDYRSSKEKAYDGEKLAAYLAEEGGKTTASNVLVRHGIVKHTMAQGLGTKIGGYAMYPSTVEDLEAMGGAAFKKLADDSLFIGDDRTSSWLAVYFKSAVYGLEGFIDIFGGDIVEDPKEEDLWMIPLPNRDRDGKLRGARRFLIEDGKAKLESDDPDTVAEGVSDNQKFPKEYSDCWGNMAGDNGMDMSILKKNQSDLISDELNEEVRSRRGKLYWVIDDVEYNAEEFIAKNFHMIKGVTDDAHVIFRDTEGGNFTMSLVPRHTNEREKLDGIWYPTNPDAFTHSADPYKTLNRVQKKALGKGTGGMSKGGMATLLEHDMRVDPINKDINEWETNRFVATYLHRYGTTEAFFEEFIMLMVYYGGMGFPEANIGELIKYVKDRGFEGYLLRDTDINGKMKDAYGFFTGTETKQTMFSLMRTHVKRHFHRNLHQDLTTDLINLKSFDDLTNHDLATAGMGCLLGSKTRTREYIAENRKEKVIPVNMFDMHTF